MSTMRKDTAKSKKKLIIPLFIIGVMVLSVFGVMLGGLANTQSTSVVKYHTFVFKQATGGYTFTSKSGDYFVANSPLQVEGFYHEIPSAFWHDLNSEKYKKMYLDASDERTVKALNIVYSNLKTKANIDISCVPEHSQDERCKELPLRECGKNEQGYVALMFELAQEKSVSYNEGCLRFKGSLGYLKGTADALVMAYAGVFNATS